MRTTSDAAIGTDLIVGFPGETERHFESYFNFVEALPLGYFHVFPYSPRTGTTASERVSSDPIDCEWNRSKWREATRGG